MYNRIVFFLLLMTLNASLAICEIVTDGSLGPATSIAGPGYQIDSSFGSLRGSNLFHSFSSFNISAAESANFSGPASVANIFSRVTGSNASIINGQLGSDIAGANLYFINPNGIIFGDNATLNLSGSFYASTADYITLQDGGRFNVDQSSDVTLSSSPVAAFGFLNASVADIQVNKSNLQVLEGKTLALIGGNINIVGDEVKSANNFSNLSNAELVATNGRIDLIALKSSGEVDIQNANPVLNNISERGDVSFTNDAEITVRGNPGGKIFIRAGNLVIEDTVMDAANTGSAEHQGVAVDIDVSGDIIMSSGSVMEQSSIQASSYSVGSAGDIYINSDQLLMTDTTGIGISIATRAFASGDSGDISINTRNLMLSGSSITTQAFSSGNSGDILITANIITQDGINSVSFISSSTFDQGNAGNINITADEYTSTGGENGFVGVAAQVTDTASGNASTGDIILDIKQIKLFNSAQINSARQAGSGSSGLVKVKSDSILISGRNQAGFASGIFTDIQDPNFSATTGVGGDIVINTDRLVVDQFGVINSLANFPATADSGKINITANTIKLGNAGTITSSGFGYGRSGQININTQTLDIVGSDQLNGSFRQSGIFAGAGAVSMGADDITINASQSITVSDGGAISADTFGNGNGGNINIYAPTINITGINAATGRASGISSGVQVNAFSLPSEGDGGTINIVGNNISISDQAIVTTQTFAGGNAGDVNINGVNISIANNAAISAKSSSSGVAGSINLQADNILKINNSIIETATTQSDGGNIKLKATKLISLQNSDITTSVQGGAGNGGNITIDPELLFINKTDIIANAFQGDGGNITMQADNMIISSDSNISASSLLGVDGRLIINTDNDDVGNQIEKMSAATSDGSVKFKQNCVSGKGLYSSFVVKKEIDTVFEQTGLIFNQFDSHDKNTLAESNQIINIVAAKK